VLVYFTPVPRYNYRVGVPGEGLLPRTVEQRCFGLTGEATWGMREAFKRAPSPSHGMPHSLAVTLPPLRCYSSSGSDLAGC